jgi:hypothetical protein
MKYFFEFIGTDNLLAFFTATLFLIAGALLISIIKSGVDWNKFIKDTRWFKAFVGVVCSAFLMRFLPVREQIGSLELLYAYAFSLGLGSDVSVRAIIALRKFLLKKAGITDLGKE